MNKIKILFVLLGMCLVCSCENNPQVNTQLGVPTEDPPICQTLWAGTSIGATLLEGGGEWFQFYEFTDTINCQEYCKKQNGIKKYVHRGTYSYNDSTRTAILRLDDGIDTLVFDSAFTQAKYKQNDDYWLWLQ